MKTRRITSSVLVLLLLTSFFASVKQVVNASTEGSPGYENQKKRVHIVFVVDPNGTVHVEGMYEGASPEEVFGLTGIAMNVSIVFTENGEISSIQVELPPEVASQFPFNSSTASLLIEYLNNLATVDLDATVSLPKETAKQFPFNATDLTISGEYSDGDLDILIDMAMEVNLTEVLRPAVGMLIGFNQSFDFPIVVQMDYSKGEYEGLIVLHLLPGLPIGDLEVNVAGNLTDICFNGTVGIIYGYYSNWEMVIDSAFMDHLEEYAENTFNASIDTSGSLLNMTEGKLSCTYINIERENTTIGENVTFDVRIHGNFIAFLAQQLRSLQLGMPLGMYDDDMGLMYNLLNDTLHKIQDASIDIAYTPADTMLYLSLTGTLHLEDLVKQISEIVAPYQEGQSIIKTFNLDSLLLLFNSTISSVQNATFELTYLREEEAVDLNLSLVISGEEVSGGIISSIDEIAQTFPPEIIEIIESLLTKRFAEIVSSRHQITYAKGFVNYTGEEKYEGDINGEVNFMKSLFLRYVDMTSPGGLPWQAYYVNETWIDIKGLNLRLSMNETSMSLELKGLALQPPIDIVNATVFKLERFFNLTQDLPFPEKNETLSVTIIGGSNSTHKVVLYNATGVPEPDEALKDALNYTVLMSWNNVTLSSLKGLQFITVPGTQAGIAIPDPEAVTPETPVIINAEETLRTRINITGASDKISIIVSNVTEPAGVEPPPGTWKVLGNYVQILVSNTSVSVNATVTMYYTDEELAEAGVAESSLKIHRWNGTDWVPIEPSYVNAEENYVWAYVNRFSIFALMGDVPPTAVTASATNIMKKMLKLVWTENMDPDFAKYEVFQLSDGGSPISIANITDRSTTSLNVTDLSPSTTYHFIIRVWDTAGLHADSSQVEATTLAPPTAVTASASDVTENSLKLTWTQSTDPLFARYEIFRSTTQGQLGTSIRNETNIAATSLAVTGLSPGTTYYFTVRVVDQEGLYADSVKLSVTTAVQLWLQPWFIGSIVAIIVVAIAVVVLLTRRKTGATA